VIVLCGDFSDDGQPVHMRGLTALLDEYTKKYGVEFLTTFGNHDPNRPFTMPGSKNDFLGVGGKNQKIASRGAVPETKAYSGVWASVPVAGQDLPTIATEEIRQLGYKELMAYMAPYGVMPQKNYLYWETPYSSYNEKNYSYDKAVAEASCEKRQYEITLQGTGGSYKKTDATKSFMVPDGTYLVEPVKGLWFAVVDGNVYVPTDKADESKPEDPANFNGSGDAGWNKMLTHKTQVIDWLKKVAIRAKANGKRLVVFNHFPMDEFYKDSNAEIADIFGAKGLDLKRKPSDATTGLLADIGVELSFAGHMHYNDTGVFRDGSKFLVNIQVPSLAAYIPAYKLVKFDGPGQVSVNTVVLRDVPNFNQLFDRYETEYSYLQSSKASVIWNHAVLDSKNYREFCNWHITELTRLRFLQSNWPAEMRELVSGLSLADFLALACLNTPVTLSQAQSMTDLPAALRVASLAGGTVAAASPVSVSASDRDSLLKAWEAARAKATGLLAAKGVTLDSYKDVPSLCVAVDFHRLLNAGELAWEDIAPRQNLYKVFNSVVAKSGPAPILVDGKISADSALTSVVQYRFLPVFATMEKSVMAPANDSFVIDFDKRAIINNSKAKLSLIDN
jgi:3',5'-cyclic AMP phosphodiesterase CpdA